MDKRHIRHLFFALALVGFYVDPVVADTTIDQFTMKCPQTAKFDFPKEAILPIDLGNQTKKPNVEAILKIISQARLNKNVDFTSCLEKPIQQIIRSLGNEIGSDRKRNRELFDAIDTVVKERLKYSSQAKNSDLPFIPDPKNRRTASAEKIIDYINYRNAHELLLIEPSEVARAFKKQVRNAWSSSENQLVELIQSLDHAIPSEEKCRNAPAACKRFFEGYNSFIDELGKDFPGLAAFRKAKGKIDQSCANEKNLEQYFMDMRTFLECQPLGVNQEKLIRSYKGPVPPRPFKLELRESSDGTKVYTANLNIDFLDAKNPSQYRKRIEECFADVGPHLFNSGKEKLELKLSSSPDIPTIEVSAKPIDRAHSYAWGTDPDCSVVAHETMHLLGLSDGYCETQNFTYKQKGKNSEYETDPTKPPLYDCRVEEPRSSLMSSHREAFKAVSGTTIITYCTCAATDVEESKTSDFQQMLKELNQLSLIIKKNEDQGIATDSKLRKRYETLNELAIEQYQRLELECESSLKAQAQPLKVCPAGFKVATTSRRDAGGPKSRDLFDGFSPAEEVILQTQSSPPARNSLLFPAQFRHIITGGCDPAGEQFRSCTADSYKTSEKNGGSDQCVAKKDPKCIPGDQAWLQ